MALTATYDATLSRIRLAAGSLGASATYAVFDRTTDAITYTTVRGGAEVTVSSQNASLDDYEWDPGVATTYRVRSYNASDVLQQTFTDSITQDLDQVWIKLVARPFLNRAVTVADFGPVERPARAGVFPVIGRSFPVSVADVRSSRRYVLQVLTESPSEAGDIDLLLATGDPVFVHVPSTSAVPSGYYAAGDTSEARTGRISDRRMFEIPLTAIAAPGPDVVGASITWQGVINAYADWTAVIAAHTDWQDLLELIGSPTDVIVP
jgi:hypothetical protein